MAIFILRNCSHQSLASAGNDNPVKFFHDPLVIESKAAPSTTLKPQELIYEQLYLLTSFIKSISFRMRNVFCLAQLKLSCGKGNLRFLYLGWSVLKVILTSFTTTVNPPGLFNTFTVNSICIIWR